MIPTSDGLQPKVRAKPASEFVADFVRKLQEGRQLAPGDEALTGKVGSTISDRSEYYV
jgi:hypothetical protein